VILLPLLRKILAFLRRVGETPLQSRIDAVGIARAVLGDCPSRLSGEVNGVLDDLVLRSLRRPPSVPVEDPEVREAPADVEAEEKAVQALAAWLDRFYVDLRPIDPRTFEIVGLRLDGCTSREIAERLGLGLRLVKRILRDIGSALGEGARISC
jgi:hypothetical protein